jgi:hypothetical protein
MSIPLNLGSAQKYPIGNMLTRELSQYCRVVSRRRTAITVNMPSDTQKNSNGNGEIMKEIYRGYMIIIAKYEDTYFI